MAKLTEYIGLNIDVPMKQSLEDELKQTNGMFANLSHLIRFIIRNHIDNRGK